MQKRVAAKGVRLKAVPQRKLKTKEFIGNEQRFFVPGPLPGANEILDARMQQAIKTTKSGKRWNLYSKMKKQWQDIIVASINLAKIQPMKKIYLHCTWHEASKKRDKDNIVAGKKFILDGLVACGIIKNDGWTHVEGFTDLFVVNRARVGVDVALWPMED